MNDDSGVNMFLLRVTNKKGPKILCAIGTLCKYCFSILILLFNYLEIPNNSFGVN